MLTVACVLADPLPGHPVRYTMSDVERLRRAAVRYIREPHRFVVYASDGIDTGRLQTRPVLPGLKGWWAKLMLFAPRPEKEKLIYYDLDSLLISDQRPLIEAPLAKFGICANFTREKRKDFPCRYGSCVMVLQPGFGDAIWSKVPAARASELGATCSWGDQEFIERAYPNASCLQDCVPPGFFLGYRDLMKHKKAPPAEAGIVIYAGGRSPETIGPDWAKQEWRK